MRIVFTALGLLAALAPFAFVASASLSTLTGPESFSCSYREWGALIGGAIAALIGIGQLFGSGWPLVARIGIAVLLIGLGGVQIARGLGHIDSPCQDLQAEFDQRVAETQALREAEDAICTEHAEACAFLDAGTALLHQADEAGSFANDASERRHGLQAGAIVGSAWSIIGLERRGASLVDAVFDVLDAEEDPMDAWLERIIITNVGLAQGNLDLARRSLFSLPEVNFPYGYATTLLDAYLAADRRDAALSLLDDVVAVGEAAEQQPDYSAGDRLLHGIALTAIQVTLELSDDAATSLATLRQAIDAASDDDLRNAATPLIELAQRLSRAGMDEEAAWILGVLAPGSSRIGVALAIAEGLIEAGRRDEATAALGQVWEDLQDQAPSGSVFRMMNDLAGAHLALDPGGSGSIAAVTVLAGALDRFDQVDLYHNGVPRLIDIAETYASAGLAAEAEETLARAAATATALDLVADRERYLAEIAIVRSEAGGIDDARAVIEALTLVSVRIAALSDLAVVLAKSGDINAARADLETIQARALDMRGILGVEALRNVIKAYAQIGLDLFHGAER